jgi:hypothetical protein
VPLVEKLDPAKLLSILGTTVHIVYLPPQFRKHTWHHSSFRILGTTVHIVYLPPQFIFLAPQFIQYTWRHTLVLGAVEWTVFVKRRESAMWEWFMRFYYRSDFLKTIPLHFYNRKEDVIVIENVRSLYWIMLFWVLMKCNDDLCVWNRMCVNITYRNNCCLVLIISLSEVHGYYFVS